MNGAVALVQVMNTIDPRLARRAGVRRCESANGDARFSREAASGPQEFLDIVAAIESLLKEAIEPDRLPHLLAEGAAMPDRDLVEYLRAEASRALADE